MPTWVYGKLACGCVHSLSQADAQRGEAMCFGRYQGSKSKRMQPITEVYGTTGLIGDEHFHPVRCDRVVEESVPLQDDGGQVRWEF